MSPSHSDPSPARPTPSRPTTDGVKPERSEVRQGWSVAVLGGGPGGYEAALVARQLGADVTVVERDGLGGSAVLTDVVPSKSLIAAASVMAEVKESPELGIHVTSMVDDAQYDVDFAGLNKRVMALAAAQSRDIENRLTSEGIRVIRGTGRLTSPTQIAVRTDDTDLVVDADVILLAVGATPRELPSALPDGERILTWKQVYSLSERPEHLIVVGSGVTGLEFAGAYDALGVKVTLVSSRAQVLPGQDPDAAEVIERVYRRRGMTILHKVRAGTVTRDADSVTVELSNGETIEGSHCLMAVGSVPNTEDMGLAEAGIATSESGHIVVDRVSRTTARTVYAAGDCTGVHALASVAAMQGRIAMWHALGDAVAPLELDLVSANVFTSPEIATVGVTAAQVEAGDVTAQSLTLPLGTNPRAKMQGFSDGFVKLFCRPGHGTVLGGVVVAPQASELIFPITLAVENRLSVDQVAGAFTVYPSFSGSLAEAARQLHQHKQA